MELFEIFVEAKKFRKALVICKQKLSPESFTNYPKGCCNDTALMLVQYLFDKGYGEFDLVSGVRNGKTHAWLEKGDLFVDVTADQFSDQQNEVMVLNNSDWHTKFSVDNKHIAKFSIYVEDDVKHLMQNLEIIKQETV